MPLKNTFSALDALKASSVASSEVERIHRAVAGLDSIAMKQVRAFDSNSIVAKLQKEVLGGRDSFLSDQVKATLESVKRGGLSEQLRGDRAKSLDMFTNPGWAKNLASKLLEESSVQSCLTTFHEKEAAELAKYLRILPRVSELVPKSSIEQLLGATRWERLMPTGSLAFKDVLSSFATQLRSADWEGALAAAGMDSEVRGQVEVAVQVIATTVTAAGDLTPQGLLSQLIASILAYGNPVVQCLLAIVYNPLILVLVGALLAPVAAKYVPGWMGDTQNEQAVIKQVKVQAARDVGFIAIAMFSDYRVVATKTLIVRSSASAGSPSVGELQLGHTVRVVETRPKFSLVAWTSPDGKVFIQGWVFSRYLKTLS